MAYSVPFMPPEGGSTGDIGLRVMLNFFDDLESEYFECYWNLDSYCCDLPGTDDDELDKMYNMMWEGDMFNSCRDAYNCTIAQKYLALTGALESF